MRHPVAFLAEMCGDVMYFAQAIRQPDRKKIVEAIVKEVNGHVENQNWNLIKRSKVPVGEPIQQSVWAMCRKRNLTTGEIVKHKARLNLHGGMQEYRVNYHDTHAQVVTWFAIRLMIVFGILFEMDMYMELPQGIETKHGNSKDHVLKLLQTSTDKSKPVKCRITISLPNCWKLDSPNHWIVFSTLETLSSGCIFVRTKTENEFF